MREGPTQCNCHALVCHPGSDEQMTRVRFIPRTGGPGIVAWLSAECMDRRAGTFRVEPA